MIFRHIRRFIFLILVHSNYTSARLSMTLMNGLHDYYQQNKISHHLNPIWGAVASITEMPSNLRFFGNLDFKYGHKDPVTGIINPKARNYAKDEGADPITKLVRILFPSPGGTFNTISAAASNFGNNIPKNADGAKLIAKILYFARKMFLIHNTEWNENQTIEQQRLSKKMLTNSSTSVKKMFENSNMLSKQQAIQILTKELGQKISSSSAIKQCINAVVNCFGNDRFLKFYPATISTQLLLSFFYEHFDSSQDLESLVNAIAQLTYGKNIPKFKAQQLTTSSWTEKENLLKQKTELNYEELIQLLKLPDYFSSVTGYSNTQPVSNGMAKLWYFDSNKKEFATDYQSPLFPECVETAIRHLINILCFDQDTEKVKFDHIIDTRLKEFLSKYRTISDLNRGDEEIRTAWNKVVAEREDIEYKQQSIQSTKYNNELGSSIKTIANILATLCGQPLLTIKDAESYTNPEKTLIEKALVRYCQLLCGERIINSNEQDVASETTNTIIKSITLRDNNIHFSILKHGKEVTFFINIKYRGHSDLKIDYPEKDYLIEENSLFSKLKDATFLADINILIEIQTLSTSSFPNFLFYEMFCKKLNDAKSKAKTLLTILSSNSTAIPKNLHNSCRQLINSIIWHDQSVASYQAIMVPFFQQIPDIGNNDYVLPITQEQRVELLNTTQDDESANSIFLKNITGLSFQQEKFISQKDLEEIIAIFPKLIELNILGCTNLTELNGSSLPKMEKLVATESSLKKFTGPFPELKNLQIAKCTNVTTINSFDFPKLEALILDDSEITTLSGIFSELNYLSLKKCKNVTTINGFDFPSLKTLIVDDSGITMFLGIFSKLTRLTALRCLNLKKIYKKNFPVLNFIFLEEKTNRGLNLSNDPITTKYEIGFKKNGELNRGIKKEKKPLEQNPLQKIKNFFKKRPKVIDKNRMLAI